MFYYTGLESEGKSVYVIDSHAFCCLTNENVPGKKVKLHSIYHRLDAFRVKNTPGELHYLTGWFGTGE